MKIKKHSQGFTLLELLVVVLIIGILAAIALPQYKVAVTKAHVASILPIMRRWKDALMEWKLMHGSYCKVEGSGGTCNKYPNADELGVAWPSDWKIINSEEPCGGSSDCFNDKWTCGIPGTRYGYVRCTYKFDNSNSFDIFMYQPDYHIEGLRDKTTCEGNMFKICSKIGKTQYSGCSDWWCRPYMM